MPASSSTQAPPTLAPTARPIAWQLATVVDTVPETPTVRTLVLEVPDWPGHRAGQHVDVRLTAEDGYQAQRSYSIASPPDEPRIALTVERLDDGEVSPYLTDELRVGDQLELRGPIGGYFVWDVTVHGPLLLVAGGSGIVPLMAILRHRAAALSGADAEPRHQVPARMLYSARRWDAVIYEQELDRLVENDPTLEVTLTLTREQPPGWTGFSRRIDRVMLAEVAWPPAERPHVYVCGPTPLVESVASALVELGHEPARVKTERFGPTGGSA
ncbi:MAG TPA: ferredoxin reductase [Gemmatimonadales bacterium]|nr:ferredoxin reductase [Gemmatimonadales bacterium]